MSIYVMTVGELAKKRGEPIGDFVKKVQSLGFDAGSHAKKLTQVDLNSLIGMLDGTTNTVVPTRKEREERVVTNPNVVMVKRPDGTALVAYVDVSVNEDSTLSLTVVESSIEPTIGETLLEFRKQLGMKVGIN